QGYARRAPNRASTMDIALQVPAPLTPRPLSRSSFGQRQSSRRVDPESPQSLDRHSRYSATTYEKEKGPALNRSGPDTSAIALFRRLGGRSPPAGPWAPCSPQTPPSAPRPASESLLPRLRCDDKTRPDHRCPAR